MERMSLEEKKKWYESHIEGIYLNYCYSWSECEVIFAKQGMYDTEEIFSPESKEESNVSCTSGMLQLEPYVEQFLCKQEWLDCDLSKVHNEIKNNSYETSIFCIIKNSKIQKRYYFKGYSQFVENCDISKIVEDAIKLNADAIYNVHNHPHKISAYPSKADIKNNARERKEIEAANLKYNWGVVSCEDYWDCEQYGKTDEEISNMIDNIGSLKSEKKKQLKDKNEYIEMSKLDVLHKIKEVAERQ